MGDKGGVIAVNGGRRVKKYRKQIFLDIADFRCVFLHTVKHKFNMAAVELQKLRFHKLGGIIVTGDADCLSCRADGFKDKVNDFVQAAFIKAIVCNKVVVLDIVLDNFLVNPVCVVRFASFPFRRRSRNVQRQGVRGMDRNGMGI